MSQRVLIAPLHWGLGHATRCIPLVRQQLQAGHEVIISANGDPKALLEGYFPEVEFIDIPFTEITYPADGNMVRHFSLRGTRLLRSIWSEHRLLQTIVRQRGIDLVISDSRFGLWTRQAKCVLVSHQLEIQSPRLQGLINRLNRWVMNRYDEVWVPDYEAPPGLAGKLSHPSKRVPRLKYIGPLSRFTQAVSPQPEKQWDAIAIVSGPEPQRSFFEANLVRQFIEDDAAALLLRGKPGQGEAQHIGKLKLVGHLGDEALAEELARTKKVIARSGYSTIMDMHILGVRAEYVPTPGQTEQEYLAGLHGPLQRGSR